MLHGIEVGDIMNTVKESVLLKTLQYKEMLEHIRTVIIYKSANLNKTDPQAIQEFNSLLGKYNEIRSPELIKEREDAVKSAEDKLAGLEDLDLSKLKFKKAKEEKTKII